MKKMLESQQKMNEAVSAVADYFRDTSYETDLELMLSATTQIVGLMELAKQQMINTRGRDELRRSADGQKDLKHIMKDNEDGGMEKYSYKGELLWLDIMEPQECGIRTGSSMNLIRRMLISF